jgi:hypothetical protein
MVPVAPEAGMYLEASSADDVGSDALANETTMFHEDDMASSPKSIAPIG